MPKQNGRVTLALIGQKQDAMHEILEELRAEFKDHVKIDKETREEVIKLQTIEEGRKWNFRAIWGAVIATAIGLVTSWLSPTSGGTSHGGF